VGQSLARMASPPLDSPAGLWDFVNQAYLGVRPASATSCGSWRPSSSTSGPYQGVDLEAEAAPGAVSDTSQGSTNACTAFAMATALALARSLAAPTAVPVALAPYYAYYFQRVVECKTNAGFCACPCAQLPPGTCADSGAATGGTGAGGTGAGSTCEPPCIDCGSYLDTARDVYQRGACPLVLRPLSVPMDAAPTATQVNAASQYKAATTCVLSADDVAGALQARKPVVALVKVSAAAQTWMRSMASQGSIPLDAAVWPSGDASVPSLEEHAVALVGIAAPSGQFIVRNSYGFSWGASGRCLLPRTVLDAILVAAVSVEPA
jgi:hypothetical protein